MKTRSIKHVVRKVGLHDRNDDVAYWRSRTFAERLEALEEIRREYNSWKYTDAEQRFQRVLRVAKLKER